ncbi:MULTISPECIES: hypothetical protein [Bacillus cereus group]|uniref:hypothetical protein n=1 Tax=Bacillus cereus group TaxID=86661 RepID=UPI000BEDB977|nr:MULTISPECIES: hypothetical protein [Bacillus cereus group]PEB95440.1 hypothetical protein CON04_30230 [Bacillus cereus]PEC24573.1 hypothetical protein CON75_28370 [Bacillus thuringiensis]PEQ70772.1 hypothetical protein CN478_29610 [Bacillus cereus]PFT24919.1 hypothetical protein COK71_29760 [Bacillus cereus]PFZ14432.1 hypothetical protein COL73_31060 [Bacillus thuringiensis]
MFAMTANKTFTKMVMVFMFTAMIMILMLTAMITMFMLTTTVMMFMLTAIIIPIHFYTSYQTRVILFYVLIANMLVY